MARIEHFALFAADLEALRAFYVEAMGLRVILDNSQAATPGYFLADDGGSVLEIIARPQGVPATPTRYVCHVAFQVEDFEAARAALERRGSRFETESAVSNAELQTAFFDDPEGNRCQIIRRSTPLGA